MTTEPTLFKTLSAAVLGITKSAQQQHTDPFTWATHLSSTLNSAGVVLPSPEVAELLVSHICWSNHVPITWKYLDMALTMKIVPPMLVLALLSVRVIPHRRSHPTAYRLFMELIKIHMFSFTPEIHCLHYDKIMKTVDDALHLSQIFDLPVAEPGVLVVQFVFSIVWQLVDASLLDEGFLALTKEKKSRWDIELQAAETEGNLHEKRIAGHEGMYKMNTLTAIEIIGELLKSKKVSRILNLARRNMSSSWGCFSQHVQLLAAHSVALRSSQCLTPEVLLELTFNNYDVSTRDFRTSLQKPFHAVIAGPLLSSASLCHGISPSSLWLPIDLFLEETLDASKVTAISAVETLAGLVKALHAVYQTTWQETFLGLWTAALRLVQRERYPYETPVSCLDECLCILLSVTPLAIKNIIEEETVVVDAVDFSGTVKSSEIQTPGKLQNDLISSLQQLGDYDKLLVPPPSVVAVADQAATRAMMFLSGVMPENGYLEDLSLKATTASDTAGNMRHLIVEACIARDLVDTSAYLWPGYVKDRSYQASNSFSGQVPAWSLLMKGSPLTPALVDALVSTPASRLGEIEKIYEIAVNGSDSEKIAAASILCGASLIRGWNIMEYTVLLITNLLSPPVPAEYSGSVSHLIGCAPFLNALLLGISSTVCLQIFSLLGMVPQLAGALMPICEVFGSCPLESSSTLVMGYEVSSHAVFSNAFTLLLRLWRFDRPPLEHSISDVTPVGSRLTPDYLLLVRNSQLALHTVKSKYQCRSKKLSLYSNPSSTEPIFMDSFPKLRHWHRQHQECLVSTVSSLGYKRSDHQIVDSLLNMMFRKADKGGQPTTPISSTSSSSGSLMDEASFQLKLPAWDILGTVPVVLDAALTACAHGRLSPRELATGLKCLADSLPATTATIASYFSAEVTRGIWKPASMNGTDWPSPAANLANVEQQIKKILAETGVDVPSLAEGGSSPPTLPLPLAALISLTITYKIDKASERLLFLIGPAMDTLAAGCPWPCLPILASLWAQKVKRWSDFLIFSASRTVFHHNSDAVGQLLRRCFTCTLGLGSYTVSNSGGVAALLDHDYESRLSGVISPVAPGILYLRVHHCVKDTMSMGEEIVSCLMQSVKDIVTSGLPAEKRDKKKKTKYGQPSLSVAMTRVKLAASLGASLIWITGGLNLVQFLIKETLPSWFMSAHKLPSDGGQKPDWTVAVLRGCALAYLAVLSGTFAWGVDSSLPTCKWRGNILNYHFKFIASAVNGEISISCDHATWRTYVSAFLSLMVECTPIWMQQVNINVLKRLSQGLRQWGEEELALALLSISGAGAMGAAVELIIECQ